MVFKFFLLFFSSCIAHAVTEKPLVVIIPSYNNAAWCVKNIASVLTQKYTNYRVLYIDDCSTDATYDLVLNAVKIFGAIDRVQMIHNDMRKGALANIYHAVHDCSDDEIILLVDGDDWLAHDRVLETINNAYQNNPIWLTYGQYKIYPNNCMGECKDIPQTICQGNRYREYDWCASHLRTFYAKLFKLIKREDLLYEGDFFQVTWDMAIMFPMLEMAGGKCMCIQDVLYIYNCANELNDFKMKLALQMYCNKLIRSKTKYTPLNRDVL